MTLGMLLTTIFHDTNFVPPVLNLEILYAAGTAINTVNMTTADVTAKLVTR